VDISGHYGTLRDTSEHKWMEVDTVDAVDAVDRSGQKWTEVERSVHKWTKVEKI
jgi:hypothetical protein